MRAAVDSPASKWSFFAGNAVEFLTKAQKAKSLIGLVNRAEYAGFPRDFVRVRTANTFIHEMRIVNLQKSQVIG